MADFNTHITTSAAVGAMYGVAGHVHWDIPIPTCILAAGLCGLAGILPDIDSETGRAQREIMNFVAAVTPMLMIDRFSHLGLSHESMALAGGCVYILIRFGVGELLQRYTVHRGMWHSIPAAAIAGLTTSLVCSCEDMTLRMYKVMAVVIGYLIHLTLDEIWAVEWSRGRIRFKKSFGTALKIFSRSWWANISTYGKLLLVASLAFGDPVMMEYVGAHPRARQTQGVVREWLDQLLFRDEQPLAGRSE